MLLTYRFFCRHVDLFAPWCAPLSHYADFVTICFDPCAHSWRVGSCAWNLFQNMCNCGDIFFKSVCRMLLAQWNLQWNPTEKETCGMVGTYWTHSFANYAKLNAKWPLGQQSWYPIGILKCLYKIVGFWMLNQKHGKYIAYLAHPSSITSVKGQSFDFAQQHHPQGCQHAKKYLAKNQNPTSDRETVPKQQREKSEIMKNHEKSRNILKKSSFTSMEMTIGSPQKSLVPTWLSRTKPPWHEQLRIATCWRPKDAPLTVSAQRTSGTTPCTSKP